MEAVILADKYSRETTKRIISHYAKHGIKNVIIVQSSERERMEELEYNGLTVVLARVGKTDNYITQLKRIKGLLTESTFFLTFGDYFCDVDLNNFMRFHKNNARAVSIATLKRGQYFYNAGFMIFDTDLFDYITEGTIELESDLLARVGQDDELAFYLFYGKCENVYRNKQIFY